MNDPGYNPRLDQKSVQHLDDFGFDTPATLAEIAEIICERMGKFEGVSEASRQRYREAADFLRRAVERIIQAALCEDG